jgi:hypothetical protein
MPRDRCRRSTIRESTAALALLVSMALVGCASDVQRARELDDAAGSWAATLSLICEQWAAEEVPSHFVDSSTSAAAKALAPERARVAAALGHDAVRAADRVLIALPQLKNAVRRGDRAGAAALTRALAAAAPATPTPPVARPQ